MKLKLLKFNYCPCGAKTICAFSLCPECRMKGGYSFGQVNPEQKRKSMIRAAGFRAKLAGGGK